MECLGKDGQLQALGLGAGVAMGQAMAGAMGNTMGGGGGGAQQKDDPYEALNKLHELMKKGILTEEEFKAKKQELLAKIK